VGEWEGGGGGVKLLERWGLEELGEVGGG